MSKIVKRGCANGLVAARAGEQLSMRPGCGHKGCCPCNRHGRDMGNIEALAQSTSLIKHRWSRKHLWIERRNT